MIGGALQRAVPTRAADLVCGDGDKEDPEECDDGNLWNGDGCSSTCSIELCGNLSIDLSEQCDDGNLWNGDGCNRYCQIEFCGDREMQETRGEQCDDGNGISGDGCSGSCKLEGGNGAASSDPSQGTEFPPPPLPVIVTQAQYVRTFLATESGEDYKSYLTDEQTIQLGTIIKKLANGRRLNTQEREWAAALSIVFQAARSAERTRYTNLLKQLISTPISLEVLAEKNIRLSHLVDTEISVAIDELKRTVAVIRRSELKNAVAVEISRLAGQGIDLTKDVPADFESYLTPGNPPISVFTTLNILKAAAEKYATTDLPASLEIVRAEVQAIRQALPIFEQEYGLKPSEAEPLLTDIENVSKTATKQDISRVVIAINRFLTLLEINKIFSQADIASFGNDQTNAALSAKRIAEAIGLSDQVVSAADIEPFLATLSASAPAGAKYFFEHGSSMQQRNALLEFLTNDDRVTALRATLHQAGRTDFDTRYEQLRTDISQVGDIGDTMTICDDSIPEALQCVNQYLTDLEAAVRGQGFFTRLIGNLQDYFGIGS